MNNKRILITGAAGFIGSSLMEHLLSLGCNVLGIDNFDNYYHKSIKLQNISKFKEKVFEKCLIKNSESVKLMMKHLCFDTVIHLAAKAGVRNSINNPDSYIKHNIEGTQNLLNYCRQFKVKKFIFASSSSVYGTNTQIPFTENLIPKPLSPYAATKIACEHLIHSFANNYNIESKCLRFFTVYGPRQRPEMAISNFITKILNDEEITVYGDGSIKRDFTFIDDIVKGISNCIFYSNDEIFEAINLGCGSTPISINELIEKIEKLTGKKAKINYETEALGDMQITWCNIDKAKNLIGFEPQFTIDKGLEKTIEYIRGHN